MKKIKELFVNSFIFYLAIELVEELLEEFFAFGITWIFTKAISTFTVVVITTFGKTIGKHIVKRITYKEGNDITSITPVPPKAVTAAEAVPRSGL